MKKILGIVIFTSYSLAAQISLNDSRISDAYTDLTNRITPRSLNNSNETVKGSPYFDSRFIESTIIYNEKPLKQKVFLRYNAFNDELEIGHSSKTSESDQALMKNNNIYCIIENSVFKYFPLIGGNPKLAKKGYVKEIFKGQHFGLYLRERKIYRDAKKAKNSLERSFPARFTDEIEWYFQENEGSLIFFKPNKKSIKNIFKTNLKHLETFLKTKKGDLKDIHYLEKLVRYIDELN